MSVAVACAAIGPTISAEEWTIPLSVPAKSIAIAKEANAVPPTRAQPTKVHLVTLPETRFPKYQLNYRQRDLLTPHQRESGELWVQLLSNGAALTIQATLRIDGKPFPKMRAEQVGHLTSIANIADPPVSPDSPTKAKTEDELKTSPSNDGGDQREENREAAQPTDPINASSVNLIHRFNTATGEQTTDNETEWLLVNWATGPALLLLKDPFHWYRSAQRPVFQILDRDHDGVIDSEELQAATESLIQCDTNGDQIVDREEIDLASRGNTIAPQVFQRRVRLLREAPEEIDLEIEIDYQTGSPAQSKLTLTKIREGLHSQLTDLHTSGTTIRFEVDSNPYELSAVYGAPSDQVSVGAVVEGYRLLPAADPNADGRVTIRERRSFISRLLLVDTNEDGKLTRDETRATTRLCFALGPIVHQELIKLSTNSPSSLSTKDPSSDPSSDPSGVPQWFLQIDQNKDGDLSRPEFPGTDKQFQDLDQNHDDLISAEEAVRFDQGAG